MNLPDAPDPLSGTPLPPLPRVYVREDPAWEYRLLMRNLAKQDAPSEDELNALGADGWEMAGLFSDSPFLYLYFKRLRP